MNATQDAFLNKHGTKWLKCPRGSVKGSCNSYDCSTTSKTDAGPEQTTQNNLPALEKIFMLLFLLPITHSFFALALPCQCGSHLTLFFKMEHQKEPKNH